MLISEFRFFIFISVNLLTSSVYDLQWWVLYLCSSKLINNNGTWCTVRFSLTCVIFDDNDDSCIYEKKDRPSGTPRHTLTHLFRCSHEVLAAWANIGNMTTAVIKPYYAWLQSRKMNRFCQRHSISLTHPASQDTPASSLPGTSLRNKEVIRTI